MNFIEYNAKLYWQEVIDQLPAKQKRAFLKQPYIDQVREAVYRVNLSFQKDNDFNNDYLTALIADTVPECPADEREQFVNVLGLLSNCVASMILPHTHYPAGVGSETLIPVRCCCLEPEKKLADELLFARAPVVPADYFKHHNEANTWLVNLPHGYETESGKKLYGIYYSVPADVLLVVGEGLDNNLEYLICQPNRKQGYCFPASASADPITAALRALDLLKLLILHYDSKRMAGHEFVEKPQYQPATKNQKLGKKTYKSRPKFSLFRTLSLDYQRNDYQRPPTDSQQEKKRIFSHSFSVKGHFRWQPYGKKEQRQHKLIWIDSFIKGTGALDVRPVKIKLEA